METHSHAVCDAAAVVASAAGHLCARCAARKKTCCQATEIYLTTGDVGRIGAHNGWKEFFEFRKPIYEQYRDFGDDPAWRAMTFRADGSRRVVRKQANEDCLFLGERGCFLPLEVRPLVCRLYPYGYTESGITGIDADYCDLELLHPGESLLAHLGMDNFDDVLRWHSMLYCEIRDDSRVSCGGPGIAAQSDLPEKT